MSKTDLTDLSVRHIAGNNLKIYVFHGNNRKELDSLGQYDVVITSFYTVSAIWRKQNDLQEPTGSIFSVRWHRIVLDEGKHSHYVIHSV
jgi:SNF2 family DNA or RNA helicase